MTKLMRREDRQLDNAGAMAILNRGSFGVLSTTDTDNRPYGVPVNFVVMEEQIYFHCAPEGHKLDNIVANDRVSFCVVGSDEVLPEKFSTRYESVIVSGKAVIVDDKILKKNALRALVAKYAPDHITAGESYIDKLIEQTRVVQVSIDRITGKARK